MNFLAHALLAGESPALVVGGVVGDWIKGDVRGAYGRAEKLTPR